MKGLIVHPGTQHSFRLARQLYRHDSLGGFWTGLAYVSDSIVGRCIRQMPARIEKPLANRRLVGVPAAKLHTRPLIELKALNRLRTGGSFQSVIFDRNAAFQRAVPERQIADSDAVIGFDTSSWILAERAQALGRPFYLDQSIGHPLSYQKICQALSKRFPDWAEELPDILPESLSTQAAEHRQAHRIVAGSSFAAGTLTENGVSAEKIVVNPYGVDLDAFRPVARPSATRPLRFLFLGSVSARKGVPLLLDAWRSLSAKGAELWLAGGLNARHARLIPDLPGLRVLGKIPHREMPDLLGQCDVLVLPSYFEGFPLVQLEALAAGMPIIGTEATGARDLISHGGEGYVIPAGDVEALRDAMERFIRAPEDLSRMSPAARRRGESYSWDAYGDRWMKLLRQSA